MRRWLEDLETRQGLDQLTARSRQLVIGSYTVLIAAMLGWGWLLSENVGSLVPTLVFVLPLVLFLPSILARRARGHAWLAFVSLLYFMIGVNVVMVPKVGGLGLLIALTALSLFTGCMGYARFRSRQLKPRQ
ncbi:MULTISPECIES: DUF2069 domain-containing protein [Halomonas]|uniref:DUF2069 domain-containing protein n=1 Tax=Halomonas halophila TaxID=29573 RepID=A0ABQ0U7J3_9GAMM|nr:MULTISPECIES: DUF2069 domain-containing protein [Halomonas]MDR5888426.1 DUF2069 domain-containing protein [Halomonas salina]RAH38324.1 DUF2069 domain-containing protein [Halomonas sp. SL1]WJY05769.1 DUF2069 domain-containing protein [Halomonas halophila]GEK74136.1 hypothetical protein HHA04nite_26800 [Halomonas halophila]